MTTPQSETPDSAVRLAAAIEQHPELWTALGEAWRDDCHGDWHNGQYVGMLRALCIVGGFDRELVRAKLQEDFG